MLGGTERVLSIKINWLASHGYKVILVTYEQGCHPIILSLHPNVTIININTPIYSLSKYCDEQLQPLSDHIVDFLKVLERRVFNEKDEKSWV